MKPSDFVCPSDHGQLVLENGVLRSTSSDKVYEIQDGIPVFSETRGYWSNVPKHTMHRVINKSIETRDWRSVVKSQIPLYERHISPLFRGDIHSFLAMNSESVVLDAGSMWGGLTIPLSQRCKCIFALDQTWESLKYLSVRSDIDGIKNIVPVESSISRLPFKNEKFDLTIFNESSAELFKN